MQVKITRRRAIVGAAGVVGAAALGVGAPYVVSRLRKPHNIIVIVADAMRGDVLFKAVNGREITPHINTLAREGVLFTNAFSAAPSTKSSVASMLSGMYPPGHGIEYHYLTLPDCMTLQKYLLGRGYRTVAVVANPYLAPEVGPDGKHRAGDFGFSSAFDVYALLGFGKQDEESALRKTEGREAYSDGGQINELFLRVFDKVSRRRFFHSTRPVFAYLHYMDSHQPWIKTAGVKGITGIFHEDGPGTIEDVYKRDEELIARIFSDGFSKESLTGGDISRLKAIYHESCAYVDGCIGELIEGLKARGIYDNTTVIFTSDHGEEMMEHGCIGHGQNLYNTALHVPLVVKTPRWQPRRVAARVSNAGLLPTVTEFFGDELGNTNLCSLAPNAAGPALDHADIFASWLGRDKVIVSDGREAMDDKDSRLCFNISSDPAELAPLPEDAAAIETLKKIRLQSARFAKDAGVVRRWSTSQWQNPWAEDQDREAAKLVTEKKITLREAAYRKSIGDFLPETAQKALAAHGQDVKINESALTPEEHRKLKALGYIN